MRRAISGLLVFLLAFTPMLGLWQPPVASAYSSYQVGFTEPADGQSNVPVNQSIKIHFNNAFNISGNYDQIQLVNNNIVNGSAGVSITKSVYGNDLILTPNAPLVHGTKYTVSVPYAAVWVHSYYDPYSGATYGNYNDSFSFTFTTETGPQETGTQVSGGIYSNTTWSKDRSPYIVTGDLVVFPDATLTVEPGVKVFFQYNTTMTVRGQLSAIGTSEQSIVFTGPEAKGSWKGIQVPVHLGGQVQLSHAELSYAENALRFYQDSCCYNAKFSTVTNSSFIKNVTGVTGSTSGRAVSIDKSKFDSNTYGVTLAYSSIADSTFANNDYAANASQLKITGSTFTGNRYAIQGSGEVLSSTVTGNTYGIVPAMYYENMSVKLSTISNNEYGVYRDSYYYYSYNNLHLSRNNISGNRTGIALRINDTVEYNNITDHIGYAVVYSGSEANKNLPNNWWGTTDPAVIQNKIYDGYDDIRVGIVNFQPMLTGPAGTTDTQAPVWSNGNYLRAGVDYGDKTKVHLYWPQASDEIGVSGYRVYQDGRNIATVPHTTMSPYEYTHTVTGLTYGTTYQFRVEAFDASGNITAGGPSTSVTTLSQYPVTSISLSSYQLSLYNQESRQLQAYVYPDYADNKRVQWYSSNPWVATVTADTYTGLATIQALSPGYTYITASSVENGYSATAYVTVQQSVYGGNTASISGRVTGPYGEGLYNASVTVAASAYGTVTQATYMDGYYSINELPSGYAAVTASAPGYQTVTQGVYLSSYQNTLLSFVLNRIGDTQGPYWPDGSSLGISELSQSSLKLHWSQAMDDAGTVTYSIYKDQALYTTVTGDVYSVQVQGLQPGQTYSFQVIASDKAGNSSKALSTTATMLSEGEAVISGRVWNGNAGAVRAKVEAFGEKGTWGVTTDSNGYFTIKPQAGFYRLKADLGELTAQATVTANTYQPADLSLYLKQGGLITGTITNQEPAGQVANIRLRAYDSEGKIVNTVRTDSAGKYAMSFPAGVYSVVAYGGDSESAQKDIPVEVGKTSIRDFSMMITAIQGKVLDAVSGKAIQGARVKAVSMTGTHSASTDSMGQYSFVLPSTTYSLTAEAPGYESFQSTASIGQGKTTVVPFQLKAVDTAPPTWPASSLLTAENETDTSVRLTWTAASDNTEVMLYEIYQNGAVVGTVYSQETTYLAVNLTPGEVYRFTVEALDVQKNRSTGGPSVVVTPGTLSVIPQPEGGKTTVGVQEELKLVLKASKAQDLYGFDVSLAYDANRFEFVGAALNTAFAAPNKASLFTSDNDGVLSLVATLIGQEQGVSGDISLVDVTFRSKELQGTGRFGYVEGSAVSSSLGVLTPIDPQQAVDVAVVVRVTGITLDQTNVELNTVTTPSAQLKAMVMPLHAENRNVIWTTSNPMVAVVDESGLVTAVGSGQAVITATTVDGGYQAFANVSVHVPVTSVELDRKELNLVFGSASTAQLKALINPAQANNQAVVWSSSNPAVAVVDENGFITAKALGSAVITVTTVEGGHQAHATVYVSGQASLTVDSDRAIVGFGETTTVTVTAAGVQDAYTFRTLLQYDAKYFDLVDVQLHEQFGSQGVNAVLTYKADQQGNITVTGSKLGDTAGVSGDIGLMKLILKAKTVDGASAVVLLKDSYYADTQAIRYTLAGSAQTIIAAAGSDVTGDGRTAINDLVMVARAFNKQAGQSEYNASLDMNDDQVIDIVDIAYIAKKVLAKQPK